ncbi:hypothetical protein LCS82_14025 [Vibrio harveyi]|uniref:glycoside hydrolase family 108 protein n=1 Tax=Vibrio harveyi TaxID=669 RepID=UPI000C7E1DDB|nr:glycosyl hydrolase 108 family protein [Vibrio harveyi]AWB00211.1 hypothetical protein CU052_13310 [Vibrio harveyi]
MKSVSQIINELIDREGPYSDNPDDPGGPTCWGWTEKNARLKGYEGDMRDFPRETAFDWYLSDYWIETGYKKVSELSQSIAIELLDSGVNAGDWRASKWLQRSLNVLNREQHDYEDISADGIVGPASLRALNDYLGKRKRDGEIVLLRCLNSWQGVHYMVCAEKRESFETFVFGWMLNRVD